MNEEMALLTNKMELWLDGMLADEEAAEIQELVQTDTEALHLLDKIKIRRAIAEQVQAESYQLKIQQWRNMKNSPQKRNWWFWGGILFAIAIAAFLIYKIVNTHGPVPSPNIPGGSSNPQTPTTAQPTTSIQEKPPQKTTPKLVFRFKSARPYDADALAMNAEIDTLEDPNQYIKVNSDFYVSNEVSDAEIFNYDPSNAYRGRDIGGKQGSSFKIAIDSLIINPEAGIRRLSAIPITDKEFGLAQQAMAFHFLKQKSYKKAILHYENYHKLNPLPDVQWMMVGFYLSDSRNHQQKLASLLDEISAPTSPPHKYQQLAKALKIQLNLK